MHNSATNANDITTLSGYALPSTSVDRICCRLPADYPLRSLVCGQSDIHLLAFNLPT